MKRYIISTVILVITLAAGYFAGHARGGVPANVDRPPAKSATTSTNMQWERFIENLRNEDQMSTALSLYSLLRLERGEIQATKEFLADRIAYFYLSYGPADQPRKRINETGMQMLRAIQDFSQTNLIFKAALERRKKDFAK